MGSPRAFGRWPAQWDYIIAQIKAAVATTGNALAPIKVVVPSKTPIVDLMPAIGVQFLGSTRVKMGQLQRMTTSKFIVTVATYIEYSPANPDTASLAVTALRPFVNDDNGGGLEPLLNQLQTLGGLASNASELTEIVFDVVRPQGGATEQSEAIAFADFTLLCYDQAHA